MQWIQNVQITVAVWFLAMKHFNEIRSLKWQLQQANCTGTCKWLFGAHSRKSHLIYETSELIARSLEDSLCGIYAEMEKIQWALTTDWDWDWGRDRDRDTETDSGAEKTKQ